MGNVRIRRPLERIDTGYLKRCIVALEVALQEIESYGESDVLYERYQVACVEQFELVLEQSGNLLRKRLAAYFASNRRADELEFNDLFRHAAKHRLIDIEAVERWLGYRDCHNDSSHNPHGENSAEAIVRLVPAFLADARALADTIRAANHG